MKAEISNIISILRLTLKKTMLLKKEFIDKRETLATAQTALYKSTGFSFKRGDLNFKTRHELAGDNEHEGPKRL